MANWLVLGADYAFFFSFSFFLSLTSCFSPDVQTLPSLSLCSCDGRLCFCLVSSGSRKTVYRRGNTSAQGFGF